MILFFMLILLILLYARYFERRELFLREYFGLYKTYIENIPHSETPQYKQAFIALEESQLRIVEYLKESGQSEPGLPLAEPAGFGYIRTGNISLYDNLLIQRRDAIPVVMSQFRIAIGFYNQRKKDSFNPYYWLELIIKLPKVVLTYLKIPTDNILVKIIQIIYWLVAILYGIYKAKAINL